MDMPPPAIANPAMEARAPIPPRPAVPPIPRPATTDPGVSIAPMRPATPAYEVDLEAAIRDIEPPSQAPFIPPAPEAPSRMPRVEDFPMVAQREIAARQRPAAQEEERGPMSLLRRLAHVGLGRRDEDDYEPPAQRRQPQMQRPAAPPVRPQGPLPQNPPRPAASDPSMRPAQPRPGPADAYRPRAGELDQHGRPTPRDRQQQIDDDQLEIPAFLRRQAN
jgi:cell division protein FtsZ